MRLSRFIRMLALRYKNIRLRAPEPNDLDMLYSWENDPDIWHISHTPSPFSKNTLKQYLSTIHDIYTDRQLRLIIESHRGISMGCIDLFDYEPLNAKAGIGILISPEFRNKGLAKEALQIILPYAFLHLNLNQVYCTILHSNTKSVRLFESVGFSYSGTLRDWISTRNGYEDARMYQMTKDEFTQE